MDKFVIDIQRNCHQQTVNMIRPSQELDTHIYSHRLSDAEFMRIYDLYNSMPDVAITQKVVTRYYKEDLVLEVSSEHMICNKIFQNYRTHDSVFELEFCRNKLVPISSTTFEVSKGMYCRQFGIVTVSGAGFRIEFEILFEKMEHNRVFDPALFHGAISRSYIFYFTDPPNTLFIAKHLHFLKSKN